MTDDHILIELELWFLKFRCKIPVSAAKRVAVQPHPENVITDMISELDNKNRVATKHQLAKTGTDS